MAEEGDRVIARVLHATTRSEEAALAVAAMWGRDIGPSERSAPGYEGGILLREGTDVLVVSCWADLLDAEAANRPLASLPPGGRGRISELRLEDSARLTPASPLHPGVDVQVLEATAEWLHVRIESREYSLPRDMAEQVLVDPDQGEGAATASDAYTVLVSRAGRANWLVRVIARASATVALSEQFSSEPAARDRFEELRADADRLDAAAFRSLHELP